MQDARYCLRSSISVKYFKVRKLQSFLEVRDFLLIKTHVQISFNQNDLLQDWATF